MDCGGRGDCRQDREQRDEGERREGERDGPLVRTAAGARMKVSGRQTLFRPAGSATPRSRLWNTGGS